LIILLIKIYKKKIHRILLYIDGTSSLKLKVPPSQDWLLFPGLMAGPYAQDITAMAGNYLARFLGQLTPTTQTHTQQRYNSKGEIEESTQRNCHCRSEQTWLL